MQAEADADYFIAERRTRLVGRRARHPSTTSLLTGLPLAVHRHRRAGAALRGGAEGADDAGADGPDRCCAGADHGPRGELRRCRCTSPLRRTSGARPSSLLRSSAASARQWDALAAALAGRYRVHALDLHGHGAGPGVARRVAAFTLADDRRARPRRLLYADAEVGAPRRPLLRRRESRSRSRRAAARAREERGRLQSRCCSAPWSRRRRRLGAMPARDVRCARRRDPQTACAPAPSRSEQRGSSSSSVVGTRRVRPHGAGAAGARSPRRMPTVLLRFEALCLPAPGVDPASCSGSRCREEALSSSQAAGRWQRQTRRLGELLRQGTRCPPAARRSCRGWDTSGRSRKPPRSTDALPPFSPSPRCRWTARCRARWRGLVAHRRRSSISAPPSVRRNRRNEVTLSALVQTPTAPGPAMWLSSTSM